jgi:hypothetical protein
MWFKYAFNTLTLLAFALLVESLPIWNYPPGDAERRKFTAAIDIAQLTLPGGWLGLLGSVSELASDSTRSMDMSLKDTLPKNA